jgi:hypothetical protein
MPSQIVFKGSSDGTELRSGDLIQFGEDVADNFCVRAAVTLITNEEEEEEDELEEEEEKGGNCKSETEEEEDLGARFTNC